jgi:hypothetical protein
VKWSGSQICFRGRGCYGIRPPDGYQSRIPLLVLNRAIPMPARRDTTIFLPPVGISVDCTTFRVAGNHSLNLSWRIIMGDKSPKSTNKLTKQKQSSANKASKKKRDAQEAKRVVSAKK